MSTITESTSQHINIRKSSKKNSDAATEIKSTEVDTSTQVKSKDVTTTFDFTTTTDFESTEVDTITDFNNACVFEKNSSTSAHQPSIQNSDHVISGNGTTGEEVELQELPQEDGSETQPQRARRKYVRGSRPARVTRISIERSQEDPSVQIKPRLKNGVLLSAPIAEVEKSLIIATAHRAITIHHPGARAIVAKFDGEHSADEISEELNAPVDVVDSVISQLLNAQLIDVSKSKIRLHNRFHSPIAERAAHTEDQSNDASFRQLQQRMVSELSQTTWVEGVVDGGVEKLSARQNFGVEIYGSNRVATLIYNALLASGVTNTRFSITSRRGNGAIGDSDLGTGVLRTTDYGLNYVNRLEELAREWSLFPTPSKNVKNLFAGHTNGDRAKTVELSEEDVTRSDRDHGVKCSGHDDAPSREDDAPGCEIVGKPCNGGKRITQCRGAYAGGNHLTVLGEDHADQTRIETFNRHDQIRQCNRAAACEVRNRVSQSDLPIADP